VDRRHPRTRPPAPVWSPPLFLPFPPCRIQRTPLPRPLDFFLKPVPPTGFTLLRLRFDCPFDQAAFNLEAGFLPPSFPPQRLQAVSRIFSDRQVSGKHGFFLFLCPPSPFCLRFYSLKKRKPFCLPLFTILPGLLGRGPFSGAFGVPLDFESGLFWAPPLLRGEGSPQATCPWKTCCHISFFFAFEGCLSI